MSQSTPIQPARRTILPRRRGWRILTILALILVLALTGVTGTGYYLIHKSLPVTEGELTLPTLEAPVTVWRDTSGVPHIEAQNEHDLFIAQGFVTAQDRMFQMDLSRRQASGQLSEVIGEKALPRDKFFRTFGLRRAAEASSPEYTGHSKDVLQWYAEGVNAYIRQAKDHNTLPIEFTILGYQPSEWQPIDTLTIAKYMSFDLAGHWKGQVFRYDLAQKFPEDKALDLFPSYPADAPTIIQAAKDNPLDVGRLFADAVIPNELNGSNNWVLSGSKTVSGLPMLSNDPHLSLATPSIWYETNLRAPGINVSGVIFAGVPSIMLGHNDKIAWGVTNVGPDVQDLYIEKRNPANKNEFEYMGKWEPAKILKEEIKVKDSAPVPYEVAITRHGPIISEFAYDESPETALSMRWTALDASAEFDGVLNFGKSQNWDEFKQALTYFHSPAQNFVFASTDGTIAYRANGLIPIRTKGDSSAPVPGWTGEYEWKGFIPWDELPTVVNPPSGYIATANNKVVDDSYPYHITNLWAQPYREKRIKQVLESKGKLSAEDMKALQFDSKNLQAEEFLPLLLPQIEKGTDGKTLRPIDRDALLLLKDWNREDRKDLGAPLLFNLWMLQIGDTLFKPEMSDQMMEMFEGRPQAVDQLIRAAASGNPGPWMRDKGGLATVAMTAFQKAVDQAVALQGSDTAKWKWGEYHRVPFHHPLASVKPLNLLFDPSSTPLPGSKVTVEAAGWDFKTGEVNHGGAWRSVVDFTDLGKSYNVVGPGQSGHLLSPWYDDQIKDWTTGGYHVTSTVPSVYSQNGHKLTLKP